ncbi:hypothetical protein [Ensifer aridi]|uniref:hypothetical protein n=1 Tax=Ensifer aridi TaxID=1708715 RepID=UPI00358F91B5
MKHHAWTMFIAAVVMGLVWLVCEYGSVTAGVVVVAGMVAILAGNMEERLSDIRKALEMHSRKVFPELWD